MENGYLQKGESEMSRLFMITPSPIRRITGKRTASIACLLVFGILLCTIFPLVSASGNTVGINTVGSQTYPTTNVGITSNTGTAAPAANYLVADKYTTTVPLTVYQVGFYAKASGNVQIAIYTNNGGFPGTKISGTSVSASVIPGPSTIAIPNTYLAAGTYWIVFDISTSNAITAIASTTSTRLYQPWAYTNGLPATTSGSWTSSAYADCVYFTGYSIEGVAKATKVQLTDNNVPVTSLSFYSHTTGNFRLAIYSDNSGPQTKLWESGDTAATVGWNYVPISTGTPTTLTLQSGTYWLVWQWNSPNKGPSYTAGSSGDGQYLPLAYGAFPATWSGGTSTSEQWSIYLTEGGLTVTPENPLGAVLALTVCFGAFAVFIKYKKTKTAQ